MADLVMMEIMAKTKWLEAMAASMHVIMDWSQGSQGTESDQQLVNSSLGQQDLVSEQEVSVSVAA